MAQALALDIISDTICPWCYIGKRRLEQALAWRPEVETDIRWRPFQLDSTIPPEGVDRGSYLEKKFGSPEAARALYARIEEAGKQEDIPFAFDLIERTPNSLDSHRLIRWAATAGLQDEVVERLFQLYFLEGEDIGEAEVLLGAAAEVGLDSELVEELLAGSSDIDLVEKEISLAQEIGVTGVPCFIFANSFALMGAQPPETLVEAVDRALFEMETATGTDG